ncbi:hypothetical protein EF847_19035 [Actinobacteria bacterium YIM 96077]|uniref:Uncharacterized protein n=1 Tax=Phytoactinopolyspora halophila TaxID=1981511 RepID=A0A329QLQ3_9ACTN|nr:hypothetical protein [Phytoactinopolyspora halophila]AYY14475.1 hypothetical protein EF847_19035 [Actinobacteria bacterium YIM 96077]RAW11468.1 hypothetical protein DPM12_16685 [Phytoactinopolyspora halophila]
MSSNFDDELRRQLNALDTDVTDIEMPGPSAARRRAARRTRNQVTTGVLASVAIVALGVAGVTQNELFSAPEPAAPGETEAPTAVPTTPDEQDDSTPPDGEQTPPDDGNGANVPDDAFLTIDDISPDDEPGVVLPEWTETEATRTPFDCAPAVPDGAAHVRYENDREGHFLQFAETTNDQVRRFAQLRADLESCLRNLDEGAGPDAPDGLSQAWAVDDVGDEAWAATYWSPREQPLQGGDMRYDLVAVHLVRAGSYVTMVINGFPSNEDYAASTLTARTTEAAQRLCEAVEQECVVEPQPTQLYPEPTGDVSGWLTVDDVVDATGLEEIDAGGEIVEESTWAHAYLPLDPTDDGAEVVETRWYRNSTENAGPAVEQRIATFPDEEAARSHYDDLVAAADAHEEPNQQAERTGSHDEPGDSAATWRVESDYGTVFVFGVMVHGETVTAISHSISDHEDRDLTADQLRDLLSRAA